MKNLPADVAAKYELSGIPDAARRQYYGFGTIDLEKVSLEQADALVSRKFPHLKLKQPEVKPTKQTSAPAANS